MIRQIAGLIVLAFLLFILFDFLVLFVLMLVTLGTLQKIVHLVIPSAYNGVSKRRKSHAE